MKYPRTATELLREFANFPKRGGYFGVVRMLRLQEEAQARLKKIDAKIGGRS